MLTLLFNRVILEYAYFRIVYHSAQLRTIFLSLKPAARRVAWHRAYLGILPIPAKTNR